MKQEDQEQTLNGNNCPGPINSGKFLTPRGPIELLTERRRQEGLRQILSIEQVEMLEAELKNQGLIPDTQNSLAQSAYQLVGLLRWRANRAGFFLKEIELVIDLPAFIINRAQTLAADLEVLAEEQNLLAARGYGWGQNFTTSSLLREISYLEGLAKYLLQRDGKKEKTPYEKAQDILLSLLAKSYFQRSEQPAVSWERHDKLRLCLPISIQEFIAELSEAKPARKIISDKEMRPQQKPN